MPVKPSKQELTRIDNKIIGIKRAIASAKAIIGTDDKEEFWENIKSVVIARLERAQAKLENFAGMNEPAIKCTLQEIECMKFFISIPDDFQHDLPRMEELLKEAQAERAAYRAKLPTD